MTKAFQARMMGGAFGLIAIISTAVWAETSVPADLAQEDAYLGVLPKVDVPENVEPIPGAVNEEFRNCEASWPAGYALARSGPEARALRDIYSFVRARNVISTRDCGCSGKVANWEGVEEIAAALRERHDVERLGWQQTESVSAEAKKLIAIAETMCGGSF
ncbi:MAG TPA: hypothetical protein DHV56_08695 [Rhodobacter sp.]|nr:hypothetical protein [Rhodobacter sp.]